MDKRSEARVSVNVKFFVHVHDCDADPDLVGVSVGVEAVDFSQHGMQFKTDQELPIETLLNITIGIGEPFTMYLLRGETRWVREVEGVSGQYYMGVLLHEAEGSDFQKWHDEFDGLFSD